MYAYLVASTGWTWEYIGQCITLPRLTALMKHWKVLPPVHVSTARIAAALGFEAKEEKKYKPVANAWQLQEAALSDSAAAALDNVPTVPRRMPK